MEYFTNLLSQHSQQYADIVLRIFLALVVIIASYVGGKILSKTLNSILKRTSVHELRASFIVGVVLTITIFFGAVLALDILGLEKLALSLLAGGGLTAIIIGFAFKDIGENFLAGLFLIFSRPFSTGDAINTEGIEGKVKDITIRYTHLRSDDGRDIYVPNSQIFKKPVTNYTKDGLRRMSFSVSIDYTDDAKQACAILSTLLKNINGVLKEPAPGAFIEALAPAHIEIQIFFWVDVFDKSHEVMTTRTNVLDECRKALVASK